MAAEAAKGAKPHTGKEDEEEGKATKVFNWDAPGEYKVAVPNVGAEHEMVWVTVAATGGGGSAGGGWNVGNCNKDASSGGGGGAHVRLEFAATLGEELTVRVGEGARGGDADGTTGGATSLSMSGGRLIANGGGGGTRYDGTPARGGEGGTAALEGDGFKAVATAAGADGTVGMTYAAYMAGHAGVGRYHGPIGAGGNSGAGAGGGLGGWNGAGEAATVAGGGGGGSTAAVGNNGGHGHVRITFTEPHDPDAAYEVYALRVPGATT